MTNGDKIRSMTDEELAEFLTEQIVNKDIWETVKESKKPTAIQLAKIKRKVNRLWNETLKQPYKEATNG